MMGKLLFIFTCLGLIAAAVTRTYAADSLWVKITPSGRPMYSHTLIKNQTIYSISSYYGIDLKDVIDANPQIEAKFIQEGTQVMIPLQISSLTEKEQGVGQAIFYEIQKGDNLFDLSTRKFGISKEHIQRLNPNIRSSLQPGTTLFLGYLAIPEAEQNNSIETVSDSVQTQVGYEAPQYSFNRLDRGVAYWEKNYHDNGRFYVLHSKAKINSIIEVSNPIAGRKVYAKVIGRIPMSYPSDAKVIVTNEVAKELKVIDSRFFVYVQYRKK